MKLLIKIFKNLTFWVLIAITAGVLIGHYFPETGVQLQPLGSYFISIIKLFINPIIFVTIVTGICGMDSLKRVGRVGGKAFIYFEVLTTLALLIGLLVAHVIQPGKGIDTSSIDSNNIKQYNGNVSISWLDFFRENTTIQVLILSIILGIILSQLNNKQKYLKPIYIASKYIFKGLHIVMIFAPIGALGGMAYTIGKYGVATLIPLAKLMLSVYITMALFILVILGGVLWYYKISIFSFLNYIRNELLIVLGTSSSEAALPSLMEKLEHMGCHKSVVGLVVPTGYSFNLDGTSIYLSMAALFLAQIFSVDLTINQMLLIVGVLMVTSKGAAGVTGSGFVILASTLGAVKVIPLEGLALLLGVDRFMSEARAITNFIGNGVAAIFISKNEKMFDQSRMYKAFNMHKEINPIKEHEITSTKQSSEVSVSSQ
ncbi:MAG: C4-dicarboxylate transporter DctA [Sediminibacterium sp.]|jgi:aerobic C4-dicarboxylate transport protein|nr:C4-dicarboxylate transporter DctA [Hydrotalea sp.]MCU0336500.1 C4-dicarboxylate transporter DctA [Sediminibacterium sp.]